MTGEITVGRITVGQKEADIEPFEDARIKRYNSINPAFTANIIPDSLVNNCSQCCMEKVNGHDNILGRMHKNIVKGCGDCTITMASEKLPYRDDKGNVVKDGKGDIVSKADMIRMLEDGEK